MGDLGTIDHDSGMRPRLRLLPLSAVLPMLKPPAAPSRAAVPGTDPERRRAAEGLVELCAQVLRGRHPLAAVQRRADRIAFGQFAALHRRFRSARPVPVSLRLRHSDVDASGGLSMVAILRAGELVRAMSLRAGHSPRSGWRLTQCRLVEP